MSKIYYRGRSTNHTIHVTPGVDYPHVLAWREQDGRPKAYQVNFINGEADVDDNLADYLVEKELAAKTRILTSMSEVV